MQNPIIDDSTAVMPRTKDSAHQGEREGAMPQAYHVPITVKNGTKRVSCDGGHEGGGHPVVWLQLDAKGENTMQQAVCPYCSRQFIASTN